MRKNIILFLFALIVIISCSKLDKHCWVIVDAAGNPIGGVCGKSENQMKSMYPDECSYYQEGGTQYCWNVDGKVYKERTENEISHLNKCFFGGMLTPTKIDCACENFFIQEKRTYKPTGSIEYVYTTLPTIINCDGTIKDKDSAIIKNTSDSLIVIYYMSLP